MVRRLRKAIGEHGPGQVARLAVRRSADRARGLAYRRESHVWYELDLARPRPAPALGDGLRLVRLGPGDAGLLAALWGGDGGLPPGADSYVVAEGDTPAFSCEIYRGRAPLLAARGGWLDLPPGTVVLENSYTSPDFRGRGVAPAAWAEIAAALAADGASAMLTKVEVENAPSRKAVEKAGFREIALMRLQQVGPRRHVEIHPPPGDAAAEFLDRALAR